MLSVIHLTCFMPISSVFTFCFCNVGVDNYIATIRKVKTILLNDKTMSMKKR